MHYFSGIIFDSFCLIASKIVVEKYYYCILDVLALPSFTPFIMGNHQTSDLIPDNIFTFFSCSLCHIASVKHHRLRVGFSAALLVIQEHNSYTFSTHWSCVMLIPWSLESNFNKVELFMQNQSILMIQHHIELICFRQGYSTPFKLRVLKKINISTRGPFFFW